MTYTLGGERGGRLRTFPNKVAALQHLANGRTNSTGGHVELLNIGTYGGDRNAAYCGWYWNYAHDMTLDQYMELGPLLARIRSLFRHLREVAPGWQDVPGTLIYWADNSETIEQAATDGTGRTRTKQLIAAHGDLC